MNSQPNRRTEHAARQINPGGWAAIALGIGFNVPYALLASLYDYPDILRRPALEALQRFADGGQALVLAWYGFLAAALALVPVAVAMSISPARLHRMPALALGAALAGVLAGFAQAVGLARWVFVVPVLARDAGSAAAQAGFEMLNAYGGVAIGEHLGQLLTAMFVVQMAIIQRREAAPRLAWLGQITAAAIAIGTAEGVAIALGRDGQMFSLATILGFLGLSLWLVATGIVMIGSRRAQATGPMSSIA